MFGRTLMCISVCFFVTHAGAEPWGYKAGVLVQHDGPYFACDTPSALYEFSAMAKLKAVEAMMSYPFCELRNERREGVVIDSFGDYVNIMSSNDDGTVLNFWTKRGFFKSEKDIEADECINKWGNACSHKGDRENWKD